MPFENIAIEMTGWSLQTKSLALSAMVVIGILAYVLSLSAKDRSIAFKTGCVLFLVSVIVMTLFFAYIEIVARSSPVAIQMREDFVNNPDNRKNLKRLTSFGYTSSPGGLAMILIVNVLGLYFVLRRDR